MTTSHDAKAVRAATLAAKAEREAANQAKCQGATYRNWWYACHGQTPPGCCYDLTNIEQADWIERARRAGVALGLVKPDEPGGKP